jgi:PIN domain nuclease of toxin-antitoxin system
LGKLRLPVPPEEYVPDRLVATRSTALAVDHEHALRVASLPPLHRDPFDRLLVAQAQTERLPLLTADPQLSGYDVEIIRA